MAVINITKENFAQEVLHSEKPVLLTLRDDPRPEIATLRRVFTEVYGERIKALIP